MEVDGWRMCEVTYSLSLGEVWLTSRGGDLSSLLLY